MEQTQEKRPSRSQRIHARRLKADKRRTTFVAEFNAKSAQAEAPLPRPRSGWWCCNRRWTDNQCDHCHHYAPWMREIRIIQVPPGREPLEFRGAWYGRTMWAHRDFSGVEGPAYPHLLKRAGWIVTYAEATAVLRCVDSSVQTFWARHIRGDTIHFGHSHCRELPRSN